MINLSVIIPAYNAEKTIIRCLDSVLAQTLKNIEIIVVNDGSEDQTEHIVSQYIKDNSEYNIRLLNKKNGGPSSARNKGIEVAKGKYIGFVDSDDVITTDMYNCLVKIADENILDVVICNILNCYPDGKKIPSAVSIPKDKVIDTNGIKEYIHPMLMQDTIFGGPCNRIYRRDFLCANQIHMPEKLGYGEDCMFQLQVFDCLDKTWFDSHCYYHYLHREGSQSSAKTARLDDTLIPLYLTRCEYGKKWGVPDDLIANYFIYCAIMDLISTLMCKNYKHKIDYLKGFYHNMIVKNGLHKASIKKTDYTIKIYMIYLFLKILMREKDAC